MSKIKVTLVNSGQDFQSFICDEEGMILEVHPFAEHPSIWIGSYLPIRNEKLMQAGQRCPIRKAYSGSYGYLRHEIKTIEQI